jgi:hypothetical protein
MRPHSRAGSGAATPRAPAAAPRAAPRRACIAFLLLLLLAAAAPPSRAATLSAVQSASQLWEQTALSAAEATLAAIQRQAPRRRLSLRAVPLDSLKVFVGRQHLLSVELDGVEYKVGRAGGAVAVYGAAAHAQSRL